MSERNSRSSSKNSSKSSSSTKSAGGSRRDHELYINTYSAGSDPHWAAYMQQQNSNSGFIQHARKDKDARFYYSEGPQPRETPTLYGRSRVGMLSAGERNRSEALIREYGQNDDNLPDLSYEQNCQNFVTGSFRRLEQNGLVKPGTSDYYSQFHKKTGKTMGDGLERDGRHFERVVPRGAPPPPPSARYGDPSIRPSTSKLDMSKFAHLATPRGRSPPRGGPSGGHRGSGWE